MERKWLTSKSVKYFHKTLYLRCLTGFWISLCERFGVSQKLLQRPLKWVDERLTLSFWTNCGSGREGRFNVVVINAAHLHYTKPKIMLCAGSDAAHGVSEICNGENLWQWFQLEMKLNDSFSRSTIPQKQFIIISSILKSI